MAAGAQFTNALVRQHVAVRGSVWRVACVTAVSTRGGVLEDEGAFFVSMALHALLLFEAAQ